MRVMQVLRDVAQRPLRILTACAQLSLASALFSTPASAATLTANPVCGVAGSSVGITGTGWAELGPPCDYLFLFDGAMFAPKQLDALFGQPNRTATIPTGATPGEHKIKVELRITSTNELRGCQQTSFRVVPSLGKNPWEAKKAGNLAQIKFDPKDVCDVPACSKIVFIQVKQMFGELAADPSQGRPLTHKEQGAPNADELDNLKGPLGSFVDAKKGEFDPYINGDDATDVRAANGGNPQGVQGPTPKIAEMTDGPRRGDGNYPPDISKITLLFEVNAFCAEGPGRGSYLGQVLWLWQRSKGESTTLGTAMILSADRRMPSPEFLDAVTKFNQVRSFPFPTPTTVVVGGGEACN